MYHLLYYTREPHIENERVSPVSHGPPEHRDYNRGVEYETNTIQLG